LEAKALLCQGLRARGYDARVEWITAGQRIDVAVLLHNRTLAIELQHSTIDLGELQRRVAGYAAQGIPQIWVPFLQGDEPRLWMGPVPEKNDPVRCIKGDTRSTSPWACFLGQLQFGHLWWWDADRDKLWKAVIRPDYSFQEATDWGGGYWKHLKRTRRLFFVETALPIDLSIAITRRSAWQRLPTCHLIELKGVS
jgi:hypothetical protein